VCVVELGSNHELLNGHQLHKILPITACHYCFKRISMKIIISLTTQQSVSLNNHPMYSNFITTSVNVNK